MSADERSGYPIGKIIFASGLGTMIEWYDFYIFGSLAVVMSQLMFPKGDPAWALIQTWALFATGFVVRPFGALVFGRVGDLIGRKYAFLVTLTIMGLSTFVIGLLPTYASIGLLAPSILLLLRLLQGLALGGEYGGAAVYVAEHVPDNKRGYYTSFIQITATLGLFVSLGVILGGEEDDERRRLQGVGLARAVPAVDRPGGDLALHPHDAEGVAALRVDQGAGEDVDRAAARELRQLGEPAHRPARALRRDRGTGHRLVHGPVLRALVPADGAEDRPRQGEHHRRRGAAAGDAVLRRLRRALRPHRTPEDHDGRQSHRRADLPADLPRHEGPRRRSEESEHADPRSLLVFIQVIYVTMVYGPIAAFLIESFPAKIRYTSFSLPYHLGNGWFGGTLPLIAGLLVAKTGNIYAGLYWVIGVALMTFIVGSIFLNESHRVEIWAEAEEARPSEPFHHRDTEDTGFFSASLCLCGDRLLLRCRDLVLLDLPVRHDERRQPQRLVSGT